MVEREFGKHLLDAGSYDALTYVLPSHLYISHWTSLSDLPFSPCTASLLMHSSILLMTLTSYYGNYFTRWTFSTKPLINLSTTLPPAPVAARSLPQLFPFKWFIFVNSIFPFLSCQNGYSQSLICLFDYISGLLVILILFIFSTVVDSASIKTRFQVSWDSSNLLGCVTLLHLPLPHTTPPHPKFPSFPTHWNLFKYIKYIFMEIFPIS